MTDKITIKIEKLIEKKEENGKKYAIYQTESFNQGGGTYSQVKLEYTKDEDLTELDSWIGKEVNIKVEKDKYSGSENILTVAWPWEVDKTFKQKSADTSNKVVADVAEGAEKAADTVKNKADELKNNAKDGKHPYLFWGVIGVLGLTLIGVIAWITSSSSKRRR